MGRIKIVDEKLREMTDQMENLKYEIRKERKRQNTDKEKIHKMELEIERISQIRQRYYDKNYGDSKKKAYARLEWSTTPTSDAQIAKELHYPKSVITALMNEPNGEKRQKILTNARNGIY